MRVFSSKMKIVVEAIKLIPAKLKDNCKVSIRNTQIATVNIIVLSGNKAATKCWLWKIWQMITN